MVENITDSTINSDAYLKFWYNFMLSPMFDSLFKLYDNYTADCEDHIFSVINNHYDIFSASEISNLFSILIVPMLIPLFIVIVGLFSIVYIPRLFYLQFCWKTQTINPRYRCCICIQVATAIILVILLFVSAVGTGKISLKLDTDIRNSIVTARGIGTTLHAQKSKFELQLNDVNNTVVNSLVSVQHLITNLPENISGRINYAIETEINAMNNCYNEFISKSDVFDICNENLEETFENFTNLARTFLLNIQITEINIENSNFNDELKTYSRREIGKVKQIINAFNGNYEFPKLKVMNDKLIEIFSEINQNFNVTLHFGESYLPIIENSIKSEKDELIRIITNFRNETEVILKILKGITKRIYPQELKNKYYKLISTSENIYRDINNNKTIFGDFYASSFIFLIPTLQYFIFGIFMVFICILVGYEIQYIYKSGFNENAPCSTFAIVLLKLITLFGLTLLWSGLLLSALCYTGALSLSVACRPIITDHLYTKYIDNVQIWSNKTWLDDIIQPWNHGYKMKNILEKCSQNVTLYQAFDVEKYWRVLDIYEQNKLNLNTTDLIHAIENAIKSRELPSSLMSSNAKKDFDSIQDELKNFSPYIISDVGLFHNNNLKIMVEKMMEFFPTSHIQLKENLNILEIIEEQHLDELLRNFVEFKYILKLCQKDFTKMQHLESLIGEKINSNVKTIVANDVLFMSNSINDVMFKTKEKLMQKVENEIGNCHFLSEAIDITTNIACNEIPIVLHMTWTLLLLNIIIMMICMILCCYMIKYIAGVQNERLHWRMRLDHERHAERTKRVNRGTLLFDRAGKFLGDSKCLVSINPKEAHE